MQDRSSTSGTAVVAGASSGIGRAGEERFDSVRCLASSGASFVVGETVTAGSVPQGEEVPSL